MHSVDGAHQVRNIAERTTVHTLESPYGGKSAAQLTKKTVT